MALTDPPGMVPSPKNQPAPDGHQPVTIRPGSGMAIIGLFVEIIRQRFMTDTDLPWVWAEDIKDATIAVESAFNEDKNHRNFRAAVYVDRDEQVTGRTVLGDFVGLNRQSGVTGFWALRTMPILIECVAAKKSESAIIADLVDIYLQASSDLIQAKFALHEMTPTTLSRTQPFLRDKTQWVTSVTFSVQFDIRWTNTPTAPLLQQIEHRVSTSGFTNATDFFERIALTSSTE